MIIYANSLLYLMVGVSFLRQPWNSGRLKSFLTNQVSINLFNIQNPKGILTNKAPTNVDTPVHELYARSCIHGPCTCGAAPSSLFGPTAVFLAVSPSLKWGSEKGNPTHKSLNKSRLSDSKVTVSRIPLCGSSFGGRFQNIGVDRGARGEKGLLEGARSKEFP